MLSSGRKIASGDATFGLVSPDWARGRLNATVMMISQGAMALGGLIWGSAAAIAEPSYALIGAAVLLLTSLLLTGRLHPLDNSSSRSSPQKSRAGRGEASGGCRRLPDGLESFLQ